MPDDLEDPQSPIDGLKKFDWGAADEDLRQFLEEGDDDDDDSDTSSVNSGNLASCPHFKKPK